MAIEKIMTEVSRIAMDTCRMIQEQGMKLNIAAQSIKDARLKLQEGKAELR